MAGESINNTTGNYLRICFSHALTALREAGIDSAAAFAGIGLDQFGSSWESYATLIDHLETSGIRPGIGLIIGDKTQLGDLGMLGYASQSSRTFWDGLNVCVPFANQLGWNIRICHRRNVDGKSEMRMQAAGMQVSKALLDQWMTLCLTGIGRLMPTSFDVDYTQLEFYFPYPEPKNIELYRQLLRGSRIFFNSSFCGWRYPVLWNDIELPTRDDIVSSFCARELALQQTQRVPKTDIGSRVRCFIYNNSARGFPTMATTAQHLNMSIATLRRKLKESGVTFEALVEDMRKEMAVALMAKPHVTGEELAYQLGYRHSSNFYAAFKGWFGCSPKEYRKWHLPQSAAVLASIVDVLCRVQEPLRQLTDGIS